jgi:secernin
MPDAAAPGRVVFGKNSDRPAGECQVLYDSAADDGSRDGTVRCAFVELPDVAEPLRTIGCRPYWCWGYETGMNERGVVGGNTAVYTRSFWLPENRREVGLTGMELLRLGLERGRTAGEAVSVIVDLLERYGQWASAVLAKDVPEGCYENAFLVADKDEAWTLETTGRRWAASRHTTGTHSLSNQLTIRSRWARGSDDLVAFAETQGWWSDDVHPLDFARAYSDHEHYARQVSHIRWRRARQLLENAAGRIDADAMMLFLRDHYEGTFLDGPQFSEYLPDFLTLCMHDSPAGFTWGNTATSVVVEIDPDAPGSSPFWCCYQPPCSSVYVAYTIGAGVPANASVPGTAGLRSESPTAAPRDEFREESLWWRLFRVIEAIARSPVERRAHVRSLFDVIEKEYLERVRSIAAKAPENGDEMRRCTEEQLSDVGGVLKHIEREWKLAHT